MDDKEKKLIALRRKYLNLRYKIESYELARNKPPDELIDQLNLFIQYYNNDRYHEALQNLTPADVYYGKSRDVLSRRKRIKKNTMLQRRRYNYSLKVA